MTLRELRDYIYGVWVKREIERFHARGGKVIMITGSYGKTSVKELAYDLLRQKFEVLKTSRNYNTVVGIAKTIKYEMTDQTKLLILEVGAYKLGEITYFCKILKPDIGVVAGIARQHLERFGSFENIIKAKTEIVRYLQIHDGKLILNGSDETLVENVKKGNFYYGAERNLVNKNGAKMIASVLGMTKVEIEKASKYFRSVPSRFEVTKDRYGMRVIDDSYNSNEKSFVQAVEYLGKQRKYFRIIVTPGLLELGLESDIVHEQLGKSIISNADCVILVGDNNRTKNLEKGMGGRVKVVHINKTLEFMEVVKGWKLKKSPLVLLENDIPDNH